MSHVPLSTVVACYTVTELPSSLPVRVCKADQITFLFLPVMDSADTWKGRGFTGVFLGRPRPGFGFMVSFSQDLKVCWLDCVLLR